MGVTLDSLRDDPKYSNDLIDGLKSGDLSVLGSIGEKINNLEFMQSLIYAYKNDKDNYDLFLEAGPAVQRAMAVEVFSDNPELILETDFVDDKEFIKANLRMCPEIIPFIAEDVRSDPHVVEIIEDIKVTTLEGHAIADPEKSTFFTERIESEPSLRQDAEFMTEAIQNDPTFLELAAQELKENFDFMREQSRGNEAVIDIVVSKADEFNFDAIQAVRESSRELTINDCMDLIDQYIEKHRDDRYQKVKDKILERGMEDPRTMKWITAMVAQMDDVSPDLMKKVVDYSMLTMEKTRRDLDQDGKMVMNMDVAQAMITPLMLRRLMSRAEEKGVTLDESMHQAVDSYVEFYDEFRPQFVEYKKRMWEAEHPTQSNNSLSREDERNTPAESEIDTDVPETEIESIDDAKTVVLQGEGGVLEAINKIGMEEITDVTQRVIMDAKSMETPVPTLDNAKKKIEEIGQ